MRLCYRGAQYEQANEPLPKPSNEQSRYAIFQLKYRGCTYWVYRYQTDDGLMVEKRLIPADPSFSRLSLKLAKLRKNTLSQ